MSEAGDGERSLIEYISTHWTAVEDPTKFVLRYGSAIREYIERLLKGRHDPEDVAQDFLARVMTRGFPERAEMRGRFRHYLKIAVRNAVIDSLRVKTPTPTHHQVLEETISVQDDDWVAYWRRCLLDKAWRMLRQYQRANPGNIYHTVLAVATEHPAADSTKLARLVSRKVGRTFRPDAFRQQLHRARRKFAEIIVAEVSDTLLDKCDEELEDELCALGLDSYVRDYRE